MIPSVVRLYHPAPWGWLYSYQALLITVRMMEHAFVILRYLFVRAPVLMLWTRLPVTRGRHPPFCRNLAEVLAPIDSRPSLSLGGRQLGSELADADDAGEVSGLMDDLVASVERPPRIWSLVGSVLRGLHTEQGPAFIKFGQILSMREELPPTIKKELQLLQDKLPPMGPKEAKKRLEKELGKSPEAVFEWVDYTPIAAGSLAQVHRAKLRREQEEVALKIRRPYLEGIVALDTIIICDIGIGLMNRILPLFRKSTDTRLFTSSYRESLEQEIDLVLEARYQEEYRRRVMSHPIYQQTNHVAKIYPEYTTTKLIVMELVKNYHRMDRLLDELTPQQLLDFATTRVEGYPQDVPLQLAFSQVALCIEGMSRWGLSHGDFHLGNLYALEPQKEGDNWKIFLCDFGMMMDLDESERVMTLQAIIGLDYFCKGSVLATAFMSDTDEPMTRKQKEKAIHAMDTVMKRYFSQPEYGGESALPFVIQLNSPTNPLSAIVYAAATLGLKGNATYYWLLLKNFAYATAMILTLATNLDVAPMMGDHPHKFMKDWAMAEIGELDVADLHTRIPEKLKYLRYGDRKKVFKSLATGEPIVPNKKSWYTDRKDVRFGNQTGLDPIPPVTELPEGPESSSPQRGRGRLDGSA